MRSINRADFVAVGSVAKTHGNKGALKLHLETDVTFKEWAFLEIQGKPVPFYIQQVHGHPDEPILQLEGVGKPETAESLLGLTVLIPSKRKAGSQDLAGDLEGYLLIDAQLGELGRVEALMEMPGQLLLQTTYQGRELLIPAVEGIVIRVLKTKKQIQVALPEGLTDI